jgi:O-antigen/teichoic acid export membrane protein
MVGNKLTAFDVGIYSAASRLSQIVTVITASIGTVLSIRSSSLVDPAHKKKFLRKTLSLGSGIFVIAALSWVISEPLVRLTVGDSFVGSAAVFKILLFVAVLGAVQTTINSNFYGLEKPQYFAFSSIVTSTVVFVSNTLLIPRFGSLGAAYSNLISAGALLLFSLIFLKFSAVSLFRKTKHTD